MRTYRYGSKRLGHEENVATPQLRWLGILSDDILLDVTSGDNESQEGSQSLPGQETSIQGSQNERPTKRARVTKANTPAESISPLSQRDRKKAVEVMREISAAGSMNGDEANQMRELQRMLMLNIKAEMQMVDNYGDITGWLDIKLTVQI
jgi:meiotic recombination protein SPO11